MLVPFSPWVAVAGALSGLALGWGGLVIVVGLG